MNKASMSGLCGLFAAVAMAGGASPVAASTVNLVTNGSFEGPTGQVPTGWKVGGAVFDGFGPVTIKYGQASEYPTGAQGEIVPMDNAHSPSPTPVGSNGVYFVSDEAENLSLYQTVHLNPGTYEIGFDSYDTYNGSVQYHDATLTAEIADVQLANFNLSSVAPGSWSSHTGKADITAAGDYLVSFVFNTPDYPNNPYPLGQTDQYYAKDVVIDQAFIIASSGGGTIIPPTVPIPASAPMFGAALVALGAIGYGFKRRNSAV